LPQTRDLVVSCAWIRDRIDVRLDDSSIDVARTRLTHEAPRIREALGAFTREDPFRTTTQALAYVGAERFGLKPTYVDLGPFALAIGPFVTIDAIPSSIDLAETNFTA